MSKDERNIIVTGGAGYVGSHTCKSLKNAGYNPITVDNLSTGHRESVKWGPFEEADISERQALLEIFKKYLPVAVLHFAGYAYVEESTKFPEKYYRNNVLGSLSLLEVMKEANCRKVVFSSSCAVYGEPVATPISEDQKPKPLSPYGRSKKMVEEILGDFDRSHGIKFTALRYFNASGADPQGEIGEIHEPETHAIPLCIQTALGLKDQFSIFGTDYPTADGTCVRDYVHVSDLAEAHVNALKRLENGGDSEVFNLGNGRGWSVKEIVQATETITGRKIPLILADRRRGDPAILIANSNKAKSQLFWEPKYRDIESSITHAWQWFSKLRNAPNFNKHL